MKFGAVLSVLFVVASVKSATTTSLPISAIIKMGLRVVLNNLKHNGNITQEGSTLVVIPESLKDVIIGSLRLDNLTVYGLDGMKFTTETKDIPDTDSEFSKANVNLTVSLDKLGLFTGYKVDLGIINEIPIYGEGKINLAISRIKVGVSVIVNVKTDFSKKNISDLNLQLAFFDSPANITGFWKNDKASEFLTGIINILEKFFCMWYTYERDCIDCIVGKVVEFAVNAYLGLLGEKLAVNCECLKNDEYRLKELIENIGNSYASEGIEGVETYLMSEEMLTVLANIYKHIVGIVTDLI